MRKLKNKKYNNNKNNFFITINYSLITIIFIVYILVGIFAFTIQKIHRIKDYQNQEQFINLDFKEQQAKVFSSLWNYAETLRGVKKIDKDEMKKEEEVILEEDPNLKHNTYIIEQQRIKELKMDEYLVKSPGGEKKFFTDGVWSLSEVKFKLISTVGGYVEINRLSNDHYVFTIEDFKVDFHYKNMAISGKISINGTTNFYLKKEKSDVNYFDEYNNRVANGSYFKSEPARNKENTLINFYKLLTDKEYYKYKQIFLAVFIIYLQIIKFKTIGINSSRKSDDDD